MDANLFRSGALRIPGVRTVAGRNSCRLVIALPPVSALALATIERRLLGCGRAHLFATAQCPARPGNAVAHVPFHGDTRPALEYDHGISHRAGASFAGGYSTPRRGALALPGRHSDATLRR